MKGGATQWLAIGGLVFTVWYIRKLDQWEREEKKRDKKSRDFYNILKKRPKH